MSVPPAGDTRHIRFSERAFEDMYQSSPLDGKDPKMLIVLALASKLDCIARHSLCVTGASQLAILNWPCRVLLEVLRFALLATPPHF